MSKNETENRVKNILGKHLAIPGGKIRETDLFRDDLNADPTDLSEALEEVSDRLCQRPPR